MRHPKATVEASIASDVTGQSDVNRVRQVLTNLLDNAVKYGGDPARVIARLERQDATVVITVSDNGRGIPLEDQPRVFERFFRGRADDNAGRPGLGIGLYVSREVVERLGGRLTFTTEDGQGTTFCLTLPVTSTESTYGSAAAGI
jgi:signal transduction histidine kinase